jgi:hypothetical protein
LPSNASPIIGRVHIEPGEVSPVHPHKPDNLISPTGDKLAGTLKVRGIFLLVREGNESPGITRAAEFIGARPVMHLTDGGPIVIAVGPDDDRIGVTCSSHDDCLMTANDTGFPLVNATRKPRTSS